ncbi:MAG: amidohydrolase [Faecousia sp.]
MIEQLIRARIHSNRDTIVEIGRSVWRNAEMGFREYSTAELVTRVFTQCGLKHIQTGLALTGVKGYLKEPVPGETVVALIGEMDALPMDRHPDANPATGASHCCGHNAQIAALLGAVYALTDPQIMDALDGNVAFLAVPAEEFVDIGFKTGLMESGAIEFGGGKSELIRLGAFDDISVAVGHHVTPSIGYAIANGSTNGFVNKVVTFTGRAAHAADAPHKGADALNAAMLALHGVDAQRETFRDKDNVRIHSFLPSAGEAMNVVAEQVVIESSVRANSIPAVQNASQKYDRAMKAGAMALGCTVRIETIPGYLPTIPVKDPGVLTEILEEHATRTDAMVYRNANFHENGSTDFGDLSQILPVLQFRTGGFEGALHNISLHVTNEELAYVQPAEIFALAAYRLLKDGAQAAAKIVTENPPLLLKEQYIHYMRGTKKSETFQGETVPVLSDDGIN